VGGGGRKLLSVAARHADIVGINPKIPEGRITAQTALDMTQTSAVQKVEWVREAAEVAGRDFAALELSVLVFAVALTDSAHAAREMIAASTGMPADLVAESPLFLVGSKNEVCEMLQARRERTGISYVVVQGNDRAQIERFAQDIVETLSGS
jgi:alkanesulfonate monooxygenase SsuD/methylene tetrahydromethanopterin reductase-like flavin-dependent oxidoreductase (luciferase family)